MEMNIFVFSVVAFDTIKIQICWAIQNDRLNLSLWKISMWLAKKWPEMGLESP